MEKEYRQYIPIDEYDALFIVNIFGITTLVQKNISKIRLKYFSYFAIPIHKELYPSSLSNKMNKHIYTNIEKKKSEKKKSKKSVSNIKQMLTKPLEEQEMNEEDNDDLHEMLKDMGLDEDDDEIEELDNDDDHDIIDQDTDF